MGQSFLKFRTGHLCPSFLLYSCMTGIILF
nr:MAG TPA: hypothetical protein [Caudoviricetes sp.]